MISEKVIFEKKIDEINKILLDKKILLKTISEILKLVPCPNNCGICCDVPPQLSNSEIKKFRKNSKRVMFKLGPNKMFTWYLKKKPNGYCRFFNEINKKCNIYESRPKVCATYPFIISNDRTIIELHVFSKCSVVQKILKTLFIIGKVKITQSDFKQCLNDRIVDKGLEKSKLLTNFHQKENSMTARIPPFSLPLLLKQFMLNEQEGGNKV